MHMKGFLQFSKLQSFGGGGKWIMDETERILINMLDLVFYSKPTIHLNNEKRINNETKIDVRLMSQLSTMSFTMNVLPAD